MVITINGGSDDLVEVDGCEGADEFYVANVPAGAVCWYGDLVAPGAAEQMRVSAIFGVGDDGDGTWHIALGQPLESVPFPDWKLTYSQEKSGYSVLVTIDAPEGTQLVNVWPDRTPS